MSSPSSSVKQSKRPGHGSRHGSSWISRLHRHHDRKHHSEEREPLLADDQPDSDVEAQEAQETQENPEPRSRLRGLVSATKQGSNKAIEAFKSFGDAALRNWKQILIACVLTLLTVLISLLIGFYLRHKGHNKPSVSVCTSTACVHAASGILYNLDPAYAQIAASKASSNTASPDYFHPSTKDLSTDACTDFNKLVCGGFDERHDLRPDQSSMFTGTLMVEESQTILRHILEGDASKISPADRQNFEKLKADYDACMDEKEIRNQGLEPLEEITERVKTFFAGPEAAWKASPVRQSQQSIAYSSGSRLTDALLYLMKSGVDAMVSAGVGVSFGVKTPVIHHKPTPRLSSLEWSP